MTKSDAKMLFLSASVFVFLTLVSSLLIPLKDYAKADSRCLYLENYTGQVAGVFEDESFDDPRVYSAATAEFAIEDIYYSLYFYFDSGEYEISFDGVIFTPLIKDHYYDIYFTSENVYVRQKILAPQTFSVDFYCFDVLVCERTVEGGAAAEAPTPTEEAGYTFLRWDKDFSNIIEDTRVDAVYEQNLYTVTFLAFGEVVDVRQVYHGEDAFPPAAPAVEGHTFVEWQDSLSITADTEISAVYEKMTYTVIFYVDGIEERRAAAEYDTLVEEYRPQRALYLFSAFAEQGQSAFDFYTPIKK
ncbi:MAG: InlB B-repeat-containing protein, partial [Clostridia bacterium]|nr:InlB B-repeat-containing protein [Clostridia bacterium]